ncbi:hypothetical protein EDB19DRAFT_1833239 [Suillus lakei]|nr:hypothetical protein EDB19DRAFT_1833239 [Suillus lakei]
MAWHDRTKPIPDLAARLITVLRKLLLVKLRCCWVHSLKNLRLSALIRGLVAQGQTDSGVDEHPKAACTLLAKTDPAIDPERMASNMTAKEAGSRAGDRTHRDCAAYTVIVLWWLQVAVSIAAG